MNAHLLALAGRIIRGSDREHPADAVLRQQLQADRRLSPDDRREVSAAVFACFRWRGWLDERHPIPDQIDRAFHLTEEFAQHPNRFPDNDLIERAVPPWASEALDVTVPWVRALQTPPRLWLRARLGTGTQVADKLHRCRPFGDGPLADTLEYQGQIDLFRTAEFHAGEFELQDLSSQAVGFVCQPNPGETWWDACAGEGGKTLHLSELMENRGLIWASDRATWRLQRLKRRAARAKVFNYRATLWDGGARLPTRTKFDGVLLDAPCSGIGTWQRNPHARWTTTPQDIVELSGVQLRTLIRAAAAVKPGGKLVYAVCTLARSETRDVLQAFSEALPQFEPFPVPDPLRPSLAASAQLWFRPEDLGGAGMFIAAWKRAAP